MMIILEKKAVKVSATCLSNGLDQVISIILESAVTREQEALRDAQ